MQIRDLKKNDMNRVIELYDIHKNEFDETPTIEEFAEEFCHKCNTCGRIICVLDMCEECDVEKEENEFEEFERNKEHYVYGL